MSRATSAKGVRMYWRANLTFILQKWRPNRIRWIRLTPVKAKRSLLRAGSPQMIVWLESAACSNGMHHRGLVCRIHGGLDQGIGHSGDVRPLSLDNPVYFTLIRAGDAVQDAAPELQAPVGVASPEILLDGA